MTSPNARIEGHYGQDDLSSKLLNALQAAGKDLDALTRDDLAAFEEFHIRGRQATRELAALLELESGMQVLDVGCGIGGPARTLAGELGCSVTGIDLVAEYVQAAAALTERVGLAGKVRFQQGDALALPVGDGAFDAVLLEHVSMNIADKPRLFTELRRVLGPRGRLGLYEVCAGEQSPPHYPVPWASDAGISFLVTPEELRSAVEKAGFTAAAWQDVSQPSLEWFRKIAEARAGRDSADSPLTMSLLMGADAGAKAANVVRNLEEGRIRVVMGSFAVV